MNEQRASAVLTAQTEYDEEGALLLAFAQGDREAARRLTLVLGPRAYGQALRLLADAAEAQDVAQEALMRLWRIAPQWRQGEARVSTWLYRVVANLCTDRLRRRRANLPLEEVPEPEDPAFSAEERLLQEGRAEALAGAMASLPERQAMAVSLRHLEGLNNPQIADIMEISVEAVESLVARGKRMLAARLEGLKSALGYADE